MSKKVFAMAAPSAGAPLQKIEIELAPLEADQVEIKITHCGVCASDHHLAAGNWGPWSVYPQVCGHEIVGTVAAAGPLVKGLAIGQRVGVGWWKEACEKCDCCAADCQAACDKSVPTCAGGNKGGFAEAIRVKALYAHAIPDELRSEDAAPLFCGGVTVYAPLVKHAPPSKSVGVVGLGGLGHLAVKFAKARGNVVTAISGGGAKRELAAQLGAHHYIDMSDAEALKAAANSLDFVLVTGTQPGFDHSQLIGLVRKMGTICYVAAQTENISVNPMGTLLSKHVNITGNTAGGHGSIRDMLRFAAAHKIAPMIEMFDWTDAQKALDGVKNNTTRFRGVLKM
jgi:uncharacterized zinc-type alcohol dehydrogenase-like protein